MNFRPELAAAVMDGTKDVTRRLTSENPRSPWWAGGCSLKVGRDYAVCPGRGKDAIGRVRIVSATLEAAGAVTDAEAVREGFAFVLDERQLQAAGDPTRLLFDTTAAAVRVLARVAHEVE